MKTYLIGEITPGMIEVAMVRFDEVVSDSSQCAAPRIPTQTHDKMVEASKRLARRQKLVQPTRYSTLFPKPPPDSCTVLK